MIITISGDIGSGKSTTGKLPCKKLDFNYLSTGAIQRQIAADMGMTTLELNHLTDSRLDIDEKIDSYTRALNDQDDNYVVDSRLAWHFIPKSYKVFLLCAKSDLQLEVRPYRQMEARSTIRRMKEGGALEGVEVYIHGAAAMTHDAVDAHHRAFFAMLTRCYDSRHYRTG